MDRMIDIPTRMIMHDFLYAAGDFLFKYYEPCKIYIHPKTLELCCYIRHKYIEEQRQCCFGCKYLSPKGCGVKSLYCKLWFCNPLIREYQSLYNRLYLYRHVADRYDLLHPRESREFVKSLFTKHNNKLRGN